MKRPTLILTLSLFILKIGAQNPVFVPTKTTQSHQNHPENTCNFAGTIAAGQFLGQSNDTDLDTIFLCLGDSILINHLGDADLSGDPDPATIPGISYGYYTCSPTVSGPSLSDVVNDPCILQGASSGLFVTQGVPNGGNTWFFNNGSLQTNFNQEQPLSMFYAPITIDDYVSSAYESGQIGIPPGPCVNMNPGERFEVVYLNEILASGISNNDGDDCLGRFTIKGGFPQYEGTALYQIDIALASDPAVKAQILNSSANLFHLASVVFSVSEPGIYSVQVEDGKSCGHQFQVDMSACIALNNIELEFDKVASTSGPGATICVPLKVKNFEIQSGTFSINWDPNLLGFKSIDHPNPAIAHFFDLDTFVNLSLISTGKLGVALFDSWNLGNPIILSDGSTLFEVCFEVLDTTAENCIEVRANNNPFQISMEGPLSQTRAITAIPGGICKSVGLTSVEGRVEIIASPNPVKAGEPAFLRILNGPPQAFQLSLYNLQGKSMFTQSFEFHGDENLLRLSTAGLLPGLYFASLKGADGVFITFKLLVI